jgi:hypothetical protein
MSNVPVSFHPMTREQAHQRIEKEFSTASQAGTLGNDGMMRVCARRAAGIAVSYWLESHHRPNWGPDVMTQLRSVQLDTSIPQPVRDASQRLTTKITEQFTSPFSTNPIEDSKIIINHFMETS